MKKAYISPQTEAMEIVANQVLMASPFINPKLDYGGTSNRPFGGN